MEDEPRFQNTALLWGCDDCMNPDPWFWVPSCWAFKWPSRIRHETWLKYLCIKSRPGEALQSYSKACFYPALFPMSALSWAAGIQMRPWKLPNRRCQILKYILFHLSEETKQNVSFISRYIFHLFLSLKGHMLYIYKKHSHLHKHSFQSPSNTAASLFTTHFFFNILLYQLILLWLVSFWNHFKLRNAFVPSYLTKSWGD